MYWKIESKRPPPHLQFGMNVVYGGGGGGVYSEFYDTSKYTHILNGKKEKKKHDIAILVNYQ